MSFVLINRQCGWTAVVTAASLGIGKAIARFLATESTAVALVARDAVALADVAAQIERCGGTALAIAADLTSTDDIDHAVAVTADEFDGIDILVNKAGSHRRRCAASGWTSPQGSARSI